jgi:hypothetical protein
MDTPTHTNNNKKYPEIINRYPQNMRPSKKYISKSNNNNKNITLISSYHTSKNYAHSHKYTTRKNPTIIYNTLSWSYTTMTTQNAHLLTPTNIIIKSQKPKETSQIPGRSLPLIFCIHVSSGPIYWGGYLPYKKIIR